MHHRPTDIGLSPGGETLSRPLTPASILFIHYPSSVCQHLGSWVSSNRYIITYSCILNFNIFESCKNHVIFLFGIGQIIRVLFACQISDCDLNSILDLLTGSDSLWVKDIPKKMSPKISIGNPIFCTPKNPPPFAQK